MNFDLGYFLLGALLIAVAVLGSFVKRLPFTTTADLSRRGRDHRAAGLPGC